MAEILSSIVSMARRFKTATAMNLIGMTLAYTICYLLLSQINYQTQYNHCIKDYEHTYVLETNILAQSGEEWISGLPGLDWPGSEILAKMPEIQDIGVTYNLWGTSSWNFVQGDTILQFNYTESNNTLMSTITDNVVDGDIQWTDDDQEGIIIPASIAKQYFGTTQAAGKSMIRLTTVSPTGRDTLTVRMPNFCVTSSSN